MDSNQRGDGGILGGEGEGFSEKSIKDTCTKTRGMGLGVRGGWLRWVREMGGKGRELYFNNNKI